MSEALVPSPPPPEGPESGVQTPSPALRRYVRSRWRTYLICDDIVVEARRLERFTTIAVHGKIAHPNPGPEEPARWTFDWPAGPRTATWQLWGWDRYASVLVLLDDDQVDIGGAVARSERLGVPLVVAEWDLQDCPEWFGEVAIPLFSKRGSLLDFAMQRWVSDYLTDGIVLVPDDFEASFSTDPLTGSGRLARASLNAMLLAVAQTETRWTTRPDVYRVNPVASGSDDIPHVAKCPPWWQRLLIHWSLGWPGRVACWYLAMWYAPNLFWSTVILTPFIQWGIRLRRRLCWQKTNRQLFEARTRIMVAQAELSGRMTLFQMMSDDLPGDEAKSRRSKLLAEQNALALQSQALGILERNFFVRHPVYAKRHFALFH